MTAGAWPSTLATPEFSNYTDVPRPNVVQSPISLGEPRRRRRWSGKLRTISFSITMSLAVYRGTFLPFYQTTIAEGALSFGMRDGIMNETGSWVMDNFSTTHVDPTNVRVTLTVTRIA